MVCNVFEIDFSLHPFYERRLLRETTSTLLTCIQESLSLGLLHFHTQTWHHCWHYTSGDFNLKIECLREFDFYVVLSFPPPNGSTYFSEEALRTKEKKHKRPSIFETFHVVTEVRWIYINKRLFSINALKLCWSI